MSKAQPVNPFNQKINIPLIILSDLDGSATYCLEVTYLPGGNDRGNSKTKKKFDRNRR